MEFDFTAFTQLEGLNIRRTNTLLDDDDIEHMFVQIQYSSGEQDKMGCYEVVEEEVQIQLKND